MYISTFFNFNTIQMLQHKKDFFSPFLFPTCFKGHLLVHHSEICRGSSPNGHLSEKVTAPPDSSSRSHFLHACGHRLTRRSLLSVCPLSAAQGEAPDTCHPAACTVVRLSVLLESNCRQNVLLYNAGITQQSHTQ